MKKIRNIRRLGVICAISAVLSLFSPDSGIAADYVNVVVPVGTDPSALFALGITNGQTNVTLAGNISGNGAGLTNLPAPTLIAGTGITTSTNGSAVTINSTATGGGLDTAGTNYFRNAANLTNIQKWASVTNADTAGILTGSQSNTLSTALQPAATNAIGGLITTQQWQTAAIANVSNTATTALQDATNAQARVSTLETNWLTLGTASTNMSGDFVASVNGNGTTITNVNAALLEGHTSDELINSAATYYFTTNLITYGVVTGRLASLDIPSVTQSATYPGPVTAGQYFASYLIPSNMMPASLEVGEYIFKFYGGHTDNTPIRNPTIGGDLYVVNASSGAVVQEFESTMQATVPYPANYFYIHVLVTNSVPRDGYAFVLKTKLITTDGYTGDYISYFGRPYLPGFNLAKAAGVWVSHAEYDPVIAGVSNIAAGAQSIATTNYTIITNQWRMLKDPSGWDGDTDNIGSYLFNTNTRTLTLTNAAGMTAYRRGVILTNATTLTFPPLGTNAGLWYIKFRDSDGAMDVSQTAWSLEDIQVASVFYMGGATNLGYVGQETHGFMPWSVHRRFHLVDGSKYIDGLTISMPNPRSFTNSSGNWIDEDLLHAVPQETNCYHISRSSTLSFPRITGPSSCPVETNTLAAYINYDLNGTLTQVPTGGGGNYVNYWLYATSLDNTTDCDYVWVVGRLVSATLATVQAETPYDLTGLFPTAEGVLLYQVTLRNSPIPVVTSIQDFRKSLVTSSSFSPTAHNILTGRDAADSHPLSAITGYDTIVTNGSTNVTLSGAFSATTNLNMNSNDIVNADALISTNGIVTSWGYVNGTNAEIMTFAGTNYYELLAANAITETNIVTNIVGGANMVITGAGTPTATVALGTTGTLTMANLIQTSASATNSWAAGTNVFTGRVSIGTNAPSAKLHIVGNQGSVGAMPSFSGLANSSFILENNSTVNGMTFLGQGTNASYSGIYFMTNSAQNYAASIFSQLDATNLAFNIGGQLAYMISNNRTMYGNGSGLTNLNNATTNGIGGSSMNWFTTNDWAGGVWQLYTDVSAFQFRRIYNDLSTNVYNVTDIGLGAGCKRIKFNGFVNSSQVNNRMFVSWTNISVKGQFAVATQVSGQSHFFYGESPVAANGNFYIICATNTLCGINVNGADY